MSIEADGGKDSGVTFAIPAGEYSSAVEAAAAGIIASDMGEEVYAALARRLVPKQPNWVENAKTLYEELKASGHVPFGFEEEEEADKALLAGILKSVFDRGAFGEVAKDKVEGG